MVAASVAARAHGIGPFGCSIRNPGQRSHGLNSIVSMPTDPKLHHVSLQDAATAVESLVVDGSGSDGSARISVDRVDVDRRVAMAAHKLLNESGVTAGPAGAAAMHALSGGEGESVRATLGLSGTSDVVVVSTDGELTDSRGR